MGEIELRVQSEVRPVCGEAGDRVDGHGLRRQSSLLGRMGTQWGAGRVEHQQGDTGNRSHKDNGCKDRINIYQSGLFWTKNSHHSDRTKIHLNFFSHLNDFSINSSHLKFGSVNQQN